MKDWDVLDIAASESESRGEGKSESESGAEGKRRILKSDP